MKNVLCLDCDFLYSEGTYHDSPYPQIWCGKDVFDAAGSFEELEMLRECKLFQELRIN